MGDEQDCDVMKTDSAHTSKGHLTKHTQQITDVCSKVHRIINEQRRLYWTSLTQTRLSNSAEWDNFCTLTSKLNNVIHDHLFVLQDIFKWKKCCRNLMVFILHKVINRLKGKAGRMLWFSFSFLNILCVFLIISCYRSERLIIIVFAKQTLERHLQLNSEIQTVRLLWDHYYPVFIFYFMIKLISERQKAC